MTVEDYDRTYEQNDVLGLNDMKTENYEEDEQHEGEKGAENGEKEGETHKEDAAH